MTDKYSVTTEEKWDVSEGYPIKMTITYDQDEYSAYFRGLDLDRDARLHPLYTVGYADPAESPPWWKLWAF